MASPVAVPSVAPRPILISPLGVTEKTLRSALSDGGITGPTSADLSAILGAVKTLEVQNPQMEAQAIALTRALQKWQRASHPGELSVLRKSSAYKTLNEMADSLLDKSTTRARCITAPGFCSAEHRGRAIISIPISTKASPSPPTSPCSFRGRRKNARRLATVCANSDSAPRSASTTRMES